MLTQRSNYQGFRGTLLTMVTPVTHQTHPGSKNVNMQAFCCLLMSKTVKLPETAHNAVEFVAVKMLCLLSKVRWQSTCFAHSIPIIKWPRAGGITRTLRNRLPLDATAIDEALSTEHTQHLSQVENGTGPRIWIWIWSVFQGCGFTCFARGPFFLLM